MDKTSTACEGLIDAAKQARRSDGKKKRKADLDEVAKHAQGILNLHKRLKTMVEEELADSNDLRAEELEKPNDQVMDMNSPDAISTEEYESYLDMLMEQELESVKAKAN